ncbi:putative inactive leucine-rich repeat receptor-like protein kinase [Acorus gramineus]|uniref:non-specific serine/threonine protein kinase n=1 Tax=Acorus gramineus TaxID=55184 RepID=A0AAV9B3R1_ACOGR|nr:putative inactive leucine-rich repeat receptor-like protein kinase [Acorus gramineus]
MIMKNHRFIIFSIFIVSFTAIATALTSDGLSLLAFKSAVSDPLSALSDWDSSSGDPCHWSGVSCSNLSASLRVVSLSLSSKNLSGYLPSEIAGLSFLRRLNLHDNLISGSLPPDLFRSDASLRSVFLHGNNISGDLPPTLCDAPRLQNLDLSRNSLSGALDGEVLRQCRQIQRLVLAGNRFSGKIPSGIWSAMTDLVQLDLSSNNLDGPIPPDLGDLNSLAGTLNLSHNRLSGKIPPELGRLPVAVSLDFRSNNLSGDIPQSGSLSNQGPTSFLNNPTLCGFPLQNPCPSSKSNPNNPSTNPEARSDGGLRPGLIVLISVADAVGVAAIGLIVVYVYWKRKDRNSSCSCTRKSKLGGGESTITLCCCRNGFPATTTTDDDASDGGGGEGDLVAIDKGFKFELDELLRASAYVLGKGRMGIVYKVVVGSTGMPVAVRRLGEGGGGGGGERYKEFAAEVEAMGRLRHPNVVRLRAYYWAQDEKLIISDFVNNGNLASALKGRAGQSLTWSIRLKIAKGTARGLAYIHDHSPKKYVHGDIKPSNILLDSDFNPLVSDFGLHRLLHITTPTTPTPPTTDSFGLPVKPFPTNPTTHYRAPESRPVGARPTQKSDVYSFGVVLLELLTGRAPEAVASPSTPSTSSSTMGEQAEIVRWVRKCFDEEGPLSEVVDPGLLGEVRVKKEVVAAFHVAMACVEVDPEARPRMKAVCDGLERIGGG